jgi:hypothetical protein
LAFAAVRCTLYLEKFGLALMIRPMPDCSAADYKKVVRANIQAFGGVFQSVKMRGRCAD